MVHVKLSDIGLLPGLTQSTMSDSEHCLSGLFPAMCLYFTAVPSALCVPLDLDYQPHLHRAGRQDIAQVFGLGATGSFKTDWSISGQIVCRVSMTISTCFIALRGQPD
jgi:hypothetical protein